MKNFLILSLCMGLSVTSFAQNVVQGEYFVDTDLGYGNNIPVTFSPSPDNSFSLDIDLSSFQGGYHKLYIRTKDSDGKWSFTARRNIELLPSEAKTTLVNGEYFIDSDPGFGKAHGIIISTPDSIILQNFSAIASGLSEGYHRMYGRFLDNEGRWSLTFRRIIEVYKSDTTKVMNAEYFFRTDLGYGNCTSATFAVPSGDGSFTFNIPRNTIPMGADTLFVRVQSDIENRWSITQILGNISEVLPLTLLNFSVIKQEGVAELSWQTTNEINTSYFNIQRSTDGISFATVGTVNAITGNVSHRNYTYPDNVSALQTGKIYYRLQMVDRDGQFSYSKIVYITLLNSLHPGIYPNPAHGYFVVGNYDARGVRTASILVRDLMGRTLINQKFTNNTEQKVNIGSLSKGMYMISIITPGNVQTQKLIVE